MAPDRCTVCSWLRRPSGHFLTWGNSRMHQAVFRQALPHMGHVARHVSFNFSYMPVEVSGYLRASCMASSWVQFNCVQARETHKKFPERRAPISSVGHKVSLTCFIGGTTSDRPHQERRRTVQMSTLGIRSERFGAFAKGSLIFPKSLAPT